MGEGMGGGLSTALRVITALTFGLDRGFPAAYCERPKMLSVWVCTYLLNRAKENILSKLTPFDLCTLVPCLHAVLQIYKLQLLIRAKFKLLNSQNAKLHLDIYGCISVAMKSCDHALFL